MKKAASHNSRMMTAAPGSAPRYASIIALAIRAAWLALCVAVLLFAWMNRDGHDMPEVVIWLMIFPTFPMGWPVGIVIGIATAFVSQHFGLAYHPFGDLIPEWLGFVATAYFQWLLCFPGCGARHARACSGAGR